MEPEVGDREVMDKIRQLKQVTLTSLGEALGQNTYDNCAEQQRLRRTLKRLVKEGLLTVIPSGRENLYVEL